MTSANDNPTRICPIITKKGHHGPLLSTQPSGRRVRWPHGYPEMPPAASRYIGRRFRADTEKSPQPALISEDLEPLASRAIPPSRERVRKVLKAEARFRARHRAKPASAS